MALTKAEHPQWRSSTDRKLAHSLSAASNNTNDLIYTLQRENRAIFCWHQVQFGNGILIKNEYKRACEK